MEKNVGSIDLEELKRAREELMQERGLTEEAPASSFEPADNVVEPVQTDSYESVEQESPIDNPNVSRVFERQEAKPVEQKQEDDDIDIDALVNEVFDDGYESQFGESMEQALEDTENYHASLKAAAEAEEPVAQEPVQETTEPEAVSQPEPVAQVEESRDFSVYDSFAAFEVNDGAAAAPPVSPMEEPVQETPELEKFAVQEPANETTSADKDEIDSKIETLNERLAESWGNNAYADVSINEWAPLPDDEPETVEEPVNNAVAEEMTESQILEEPAVQETALEEPVQETASIDSLAAFEVEEQKSEDDLSQEDVNDMAFASLAGLGSFEFDSAQKPEDKPVAPIAEEVEEPEVLVENASEELEKPEESAEETPAPEESTDSMSMVSSLHDLEMMMKEDEERVAKLDEEIEKLEQQVETGEILEDEEGAGEETTTEEPSAYKKIEPYKFVDVINLDEFKDSDKLTYVLGKDEQNVMHYGNLRDNYNMVVFGKESEYTNNFVHSVLLSLILKNTVNEVNFVICDSKADSKFEVYNKSSYMYFNRIAKTNKEILDILIELNKELEERYKLLAEIGVKSIEQYNIIAKNDNLKPLPYIVTVFNNYSKAIQLTESDKINTCLYQILKFGRIAGLYIVLTANNTIMSNEINYNLPTRISFKCADSAMSLTTLGEDGAEKLAADGDFLCSTIGAEKLLHMKVATLTSNEIELLIENIED